MFCICQGTEAVVMTAKDTEKGLESCQTGAGTHWGSVCAPGGGLQGIPAVCVLFRHCRFSSPLALHSVFTIFPGRRILQSWWHCVDEVLAPLSSAFEAAGSRVGPVLVAFLPGVFPPPYPGQDETSYYLCTWGPAVGISLSLGWPSWALGVGIASPPQLPGLLCSWLLLCGGPTACQRQLA